MNSEKTKLKDILLKWGMISKQITMQKSFRFSKEAGLSFAQMITLHKLRHGQAAVSEFSAMLSISNAAVSQMLEKLVEQDLVIRTESSRDRRHKTLDITEKGKVLLQHMNEETEAWVIDLIDSLDHREILIITKALELLVEKSGSYQQKEKKS